METTTFESKNATTRSMRGEGRSTGLDAIRVLNATATFWFVTASLGQFLFAAYMLGFYGRTAVQGRMTAWNNVLIHGIVAGDLIGNLAVATHIVLAFIITVGGPIQFIPKLRSIAPRFHRWNGRLYILTAVAISLGGLFMVWTRGVLGGLSNHIAISLNAILIMAFAVPAIRYAMARRFEQHRRWTMRLFLAVNGVWFFRVGLMLWIFLNKGPVGVGKHLDGPFAISWAYGQYLLPLAIHELYLFARNKTGATGRYAMAATLVVLTLGTGVGIAIAFIGMWLPRI